MTGVQTCALPIYVLQFPVLITLGWRVEMEGGDGGREGWRDDTLKEMRSQSDGGSRMKG